MSERSLYDEIQVGMPLGPFEVVLDEKTLREEMERVQWGNREMAEREGLVPPGLTIVNHARMQFLKLTELKAAIWAKSEHEFLRPIAAGSRVVIHGKVVEKYEKRGKRYVVGEFETVNEAGEPVLRSRETSVYVE